MQVQPYLNFNGRCEEAIEFYKRAIGAKVEMLMRNKECPETAPPGTFPPGSENKVMHASLKIGDSVVMATDGRMNEPPAFKGFSLTVSVPDAASADRVFAAITDGGQATMPLAKTFFAPRFGMGVDRFGVSWMVIVPQ
jgi:PhnB protein